MKGSITFSFDGDLRDYQVRVSKHGEFDSVDLEAVAALIAEDIVMAKSVESGEFKRLSSDPTGIRQLHDTWIN